MTEAEGRRMYSPNFPYSTFRAPSGSPIPQQVPDVEDALRAPAPDGCLVCIAEGKARIVADGIYFANGVAVDSRETYVYVAETMKRRGGALPKSTRMDRLVRKRSTVQTSWGSWISGRHRLR
jgi:sugar lactone lactonase YvrE